MAEFCLKDLVRRAGREAEFEIASAALHTDEIGNPVYPPARRELAAHGIVCAGKAARLIQRGEYTRWDRIVGMDEANRRDLLRLFPGDPDGRISLLLDGTDHPHPVADPWYTGDFTATWRDVLEGCRALLAAIPDPRTPFNSVPEAFDRWRPRYCNALFDCVANRAALGPGRRSLEIGPGTGQATEFALRTGADCTAIELGANLAAFCARKFARYPNFHLVHGDFATHPFEPASFDLVYSAATIQWIGEEIAYPRCRDLLRPGGTLAMFFTKSDYQTPNPALYADIQKVYDAWYRTATPYTKRFDYEKAGDWGFQAMERREFPFRRVFTADEYVAYIGTHSDHIGLRPECRKPFYGGIRAAIERHGGALEMVGAYILYLWTRGHPESVAVIPSAGRR